MRFHLREQRPRRGLTIATLAALLASLLPMLVAAPATADIGDCRTVYGKSGTSSSGYAKICLRDFDQDAGTAKLEVTAQARRNAPNNVYVSYRFSYGGYMITMGRLGPNAPKSYTKTVDSDAADPETVGVRLCYDKTARQDPCYSWKVLDPGWDLYGIDRTAPVLDKPLASLASATSRVANYSIAATDDSGTVAEMRVKATGDPAWRPWVAYVPSGTVILPDRYGDFTIFFQVKDAAGNVSSMRAADNVTRIQDVTGPSLTGTISKADPAARDVSYSLIATDDYNPVTQMRVLISGEDWRPWVPFSPTGTVVLPDGYGRFGVSFQVMDAAGNASAPLFAGAVTRTAPVSLALRQIDNLGNLRTCGSSEATPCTDVVKRFRTTIDSPIVPNTNLLLKAWRNVNGAWVETSTSPFMFEAIAGRRTVDMTITANLLAGVWRFQAQVPRDGDVSEFAASGYQYLRIG